MNSICWTITRATGVTSGAPSAWKYSGVGVRAAEIARQDRDDVLVTGHNPGMQVGIPVHRVECAKAVVKRIRIGQDIRIQQQIKAQRRFFLGGLHELFPNVVVILLAGTPDTNPKR